MNICRVCQSFDANLKGLSSHLVPLTKEQSKLGVKIDVVSKFPEKIFKKMNKNIKLHYFNPKRTGVYNFFPFSSLNYGFKAYEKIKGLDFDIIHGHQGVVFGLVLKKLKKPFVYSCHDSVILPSEYSLFNNVNFKTKYSSFLITKFLTKKADKVTAVSDFVKNRLIKYYNVPSNKVVTISSGVDLNKFKPMKVKKNDKFTVLFVGRFIKRKGVHTILSSILKILKVSDIQFVFVGGRKEDELYSLVKSFEKKYSSNIKVIDWVGQKELPKLYNKCDLFVHPSVFEAASKVFLEAMACGKPVINCRNSGYSKMIKKNNCGKLVDFNSVSQLTKAILYFNKQNKDLKKNCLRTVKNFTWKKLAKKYKPVYEDLI